MRLKPTEDRKTKFRNGQANTFGLLPGNSGLGTCPCATTGPGGCLHVAAHRKTPACYVYNTMRCYRGVEPVLAHNTQLLRDGSLAAKYRLLTAEFERFRGAELHQKTPQLFYRLHWSGDVFDHNYAIALSESMTAFPDVKFWAYTRVFSHAAWLVNHTPNLILYLSLDPVNFYPGIQTFVEWSTNSNPQGDMRLCYMSPKNDFAQRYERGYYASLVAAALDVQSVTGTPVTPWPAPERAPVLHPCPVDAGKLPLEGGCAKCRQCTGKKPAHIWFET